MPDPVLEQQVALVEPTVEEEGLPTTSQPASSAVAENVAEPPMPDLPVDPIAFKPTVDAEKGSPATRSQPADSAVPAPVSIPQGPKLFEFHFFCFCFFNDNMNFEMTSVFDS